MTKAIGGSKQCSFDEKSVGRKSKNAETQPLEGQTSAEKAVLFWANPRFLGKKHGKGGSG